MSRVCAPGSPVAASPSASKPDTKSVLPARTAGLRFGFGCAAMSIPCRGAADATNVISTLYAGAVRLAPTVARAGRSGPTTSR